MGKRVLVCGGRDYANRTAVFAALDALALEVGGVDVIIQGEASGADRLARAWAKLHGVRCAGYHARWDDMVAPPLAIRTRPDGSRYNAAAGGVRNQYMLDDGRPDVAVSFRGGAGTADMVRRVLAAGFVERAGGIEPRVFSLEGCGSTIELGPRRMADGTIATPLPAPKA